MKKGILLKYFYYLLITIGLIYLIPALILFYIGPITTLIVKHKLKNNPVDIVVSLTTTPYRIDTIKPVLDAIFRQSIKPTRVYVNVPYVFKRENMEYIIPEWLKSYPNIIINRTKDYGPATKLIGTLEKERDPNTIIVTFDDDRIYTRHAVRDLVKKHIIKDFEYNYNVVFAGYSLNLLFGPQFYSYPIEINLNEQHGLLVVGAGGVGYVRRFFNDDIFSLLDNLPLSCFLSDDLMISAYLHNNNIEIRKTSDVSYNLFFTKSLWRMMPTNSSPDALLRGANNVGLGGNLQNYSHCLTTLPSYGKARYQEIILDKSSTINFWYQNDLFQTVVLQVYYHYLDRLINIIPFMKKIIIKTMD